MSITIVFFLGLFVALVGVIPPGLLNMTAAKISLKEGAGRGIMFSTGVCLVVFVQTYIAAIFARYLSNRPDVVEILQRVAFVIFVLITVYFLILAAKQKKKEKLEDVADIRSKKTRFFYGVLLSALNVFPIPYQAFMTITLASFGVMDFQRLSIITYVTGAAMGTFVMLYIYIFFFDKIKDKAFTSQKNMNYIIGSVTGLVALVTFINILKDL